MPRPVHLPRSPLAWLPFLWGRVLFPGAPDAAIRVRLLSLLLVVLLPAILLYPCRSFLLLEPDEGRYAQIPKEMLDRGEWVVPTLQGEPYLDKPPLMYWLVRLSYAAFGVNEAAARLVPALCVQLTILAVYLIGRRSIGERGALWAALLLSVSPGYIGVARLLLLDGLLTLCVTLSLLCGFEAVRTGRLQRGWWLAAALASGLGFLTKGPISEVLLFVPLFAFAWLNRTTARVGWKQVALFLGIVFSVNLPWYVAIYLRQPEFLRHFFWDHNVMRFLQPFDHLQPVWYYVPILLGGFLPGVVLALPYLRSLLQLEGEKRRKGDKERVATDPISLSPLLPLSPSGSQAGGFWLLAGLWCVAFFSFSGSKLPTYILPAFPPLCLALGEYVARSRWNQSFATRGLIAGFALLLGAVHYVGLPWYARERSPMGRPELVEKFVNDPNTVVVTYPRDCNSVAFYTGRGDLQKVRTKDVNQFIVDSHFRPRTVVLFTHAHSLASFREALPPTLRITEAVSLRRKGKSLVDKLLGGSPWGLCDIAVLEPVK
jgi:4-amino-4-deoxy-L-arabinose transferase-like glycosyltransferase